MPAQSVCRRGGEALDIEGRGGRKLEEEEKYDDDGEKRNPVESATIAKMEYSNLSRAHFFRRFEIMDVP